MKTLFELDLFAAQISSGSVGVYLDLTQLIEKCPMFSSDIECVFKVLFEDGFQGSDWALFNHACSALGTAHG